MCGGELKRKNFPPPHMSSSCLFPPTFHTLGCWKALPPSHRSSDQLFAWRDAQSWGASAMLSTNHPLSPGPCLASSWSRDRIKVSTMSEVAGFLLGGREWKAERRGEGTCAEHRTPTDRIGAGLQKRKELTGNFLHRTYWDHFMALISRETSSLHIYCFLSADHLQAPPFTKSWDINWSLYHCNIFGKSKTSCYKAINWRLYCVLFIITLGFGDP